MLERKGMGNNEMSGIGCTVTLKNGVGVPRCETVMVVTPPSDESILNSARHSRIL